MSDTDTIPPDAGAEAVQHPFQAEVGRLLEIVAKSLYSQKEVFLRELISNASDACDKLRYQAIAAPDLLAGDAGFEIRLTVDVEAKTLTVADTGIGMDRDELVDNLGTIARSGTKRFLEALSGEGAKDMGLIGQFGVGFYAAFMVADRVVVETRKAGTDQAWAWTSDGRTGFSVAPLAGDGAPARGSRVILHLAEDAGEFLEQSRLAHIVKTYSDHIPVPILFGDGAEAETLNRASALWTRPKSEIAEDDYKEFYHHVAHAFDDPWLTVHYRAEGMIEYTGLLFVPSTAPFDLYHPERRHGVKLYVRRVFVAEQAEGLLPSYLRFLRGVVDSEDLPLNISREMLQNEPMVAKIKKGLTKRVLDELGKRADAPDGDYARFWDSFGPVLKEGLHEDFENRDRLVDLLRVRTTGRGGLASVDDLIAGRKDGQDALYYITGDDPVTLARSPQLEGFKARGIEVMLLTDPVDEFWIGMLGGTIKDTPLKSVTKSGADLGRIKKPDAEDGANTDPDADADAADAQKSGGLDALIAGFKLTLGDEVADVRRSDRLTETAVCLVADEGGMDLHLERMLKRHKQLDSLSKPILELNPDHPLVKTLADRALAAEGGDPVLADMAHLMLDQARILDGEAVKDPAAFSRRLADALSRGLAG